ncbi:MAG TPA: hypothetical protein VMZ91_06290 [Candidatus Paceibacterota bacterium]|nr:hypothetical protein [Candidatus Paceibacterota bacterium]
MRFIVFVDALDSNDLSPWFKEHLITEYNPGIPKVTPNVISQIMTGNKQEDMRFIRSTPYKKPREGNILDKTILHYATEERKLRILQYGIPLCSHIQLPEGSLSTYDHFLGGQNIPAVLQFPENNINFMKDDPELIFHSYVDQTASLFCTMRTVARNGAFDTIFIGYTFIDAYTHWYHEENKKRLVEYLEMELKDLNRYGEILFFSDHGSTKKTKDFFINKWLYEKGYLHYDINFKLVNFHESYNKKFPDQIQLEHQHVFIDWEKTKFFSVDAFDAMIDKTDLATKEDCIQLKEELMETGMFNNIFLKDELFNPNGKEYDFCPWIMPDTAEGIMTTGNIHPNAGEPGSKSMDVIRPGWHSCRGVVGSTDKDLKTTINKPGDIYHLMKEFIDKQEPEAAKRMKRYEEEPDIIENKLAELGYM